MEPNNWVEDWLGARADPEETKGSYKRNIRIFNNPASVSSLGIITATLNLKIFLRNKTLSIPAITSFL